MILYSEGVRSKGADLLVSFRSPLLNCNLTTEQFGNIIKGCITFSYLVGFLCLSYNILHQSLKWQSDYMAGFITILIWLASTDFCHCSHWDDSVSFNASELW